MYDSNQNELEILKFWDENKTFEKSVTERPTNAPYVFYDGPPFATGLPHYGHIVASLMKDTVPRYWTMNGKRVERRWGWDCHGLPIENIIEKELNLNSKKDIENYGVAKFNEACRATVLKYANEWKKTIKRMGRWVDMENDYKTMDLSYMESVWWVFKQLWDHGLIYKGHKAMHICPRCVTPLSNFEVTQGYKEIKDLSATVKFKLKEPGRIGLSGAVFVLAWTTTPWTLPGNVALAVNEKIKYVVISFAEEKYILAKERLGDIFKDKEYKIEKEIEGVSLPFLTYEPLFPYYADTIKDFRILPGDFVSTEEGTGVVHIAPAFGDDDYKLGKKYSIPLVQHVSMDGRFVEEVLDFAGQEVKPREQPTATDVEIIKWLAHNNKLFSKEKLEHSYPHCWRCDTPLLNYATSSWFVEVTKLKDQLLKNNQNINWVPANIKEGRFGQWLEGARDWAISRNRFWGTPLPVWECSDTKCGQTIAFGSVAEMEKTVGQKVTDLHKHIIDNLTFPCAKCGKTMKRIPEVLDCWFESGSMPYGQMHYPFENKTKFESGFPAEFIAEGQDQTRGWFYTLHVLAAALTAKPKPAIPVKQSLPAFRNVIVNGIVLAEDGKKMSKRLKNYPEPEVVLNKYGADALRYYLVSSPVMEAENLNFSESGVREVYNKLINTLWNVVEFYKMYAEKSVPKTVKTPSNLLDIWILTKLQLLIKDVTTNMNNYQLVGASRPIVDFVTELSQWYLRRSRDRFKGDDAKDKQAALATLREVLLTLSKIMAPFTPFIAEKIYLELTGGAESVHLQKWPKAAPADQEALTAMEFVRSFTTMALMQRTQFGIKVRQPLSKLSIGHSFKQPLTSYWDQAKNILADEINVKEVVLDPNMTQADPPVKLDATITPELEEEGLVRELTRQINQFRKESKLTINDLVELHLNADEKTNAVIKKFAEEIKKATLARDLKIERGNTDWQKETDIDGKKIWLGISR